MKREEENDLIQDQEEKEPVQEEKGKELPPFVPMLCGAVTLICLTISLIVAVPSLTKADYLSPDDMSVSDYTDDDQNPSSPEQDDQDNRNPNDFMDEFNSSEDDFGGDNIGYDIFVD
ncbi:MAG: hypothetical protein HFE78_03130 [Clostridiales bacterium]|nr:hypothetical protein [Clostridiales bacterium]